MRGQSIGAAVVTALALALTACGAPTTSATPVETPIIAPAGEILIPVCPADATCSEDFVVGETRYGLICEGVDPAAISDEPLATDEGMFTEVRVITGIPSELWVAVRGDLPCRPAQEAPLEHEWYLAQSDVETADLEEWGEAVADVVLP